MHKVTKNIAKLEHVAELSTRLREDDINELKAMGYEPIEGLLHSFLMSDRCYSVFVDGELSAMYGIGKFTKGWGIVWMLGSDNLFKAPLREFITLPKLVIKNWLTEYDVIFNKVDTRNKTHVNWLRHLGFTFGGSEIINGVEFKQFFKTKERGK